MKKFSVDRIGEPSECIRAHAQSARNIRIKGYSSIRNSNTELSTIVCNAGMRIVEIRQFCNLPEDAQSLMRAKHGILKLA
jgi:hypothetical protein